jgi:hypothetical protein
MWRRMGQERQDLGGWRCVGYTSYAGGNRVLSWGSATKRAIASEEPRMHACAHTRSTRAHIAHAHTHTCMHSEHTALGFRV